jgi:hypothetical protein
VDRTRREGIPVTSLSRTILDLAVASRARAVRRHIQIADYAHLFDLREMHHLLDRTKGDRIRDDELLHAGIETTRVTGPRLDREPGKVVDSLRRHLARRSAGGPPKG